jgi:hypothetical protein
LGFGDVFGVGYRQDGAFVDFLNIKPNKLIR